MGKDKIAFVVVRYGADINGGAEYHCRMLAERLVDDYDVEVLKKVENLGTEIYFHIIPEDVPQKFSEILKKY